MLYLLFLIYLSFSLSPPVHKCARPNDQKCRLCSPCSLYPASTFSNARGLKKELEVTVQSQDFALDEISKTLFSHLQNVEYTAGGVYSGKPPAFFFTGIAAVGKTRTYESIAKVLFKYNRGKELNERALTENLLVIDASLLSFPNITIKNTGSFYDSYETVDTSLYLRQTVAHQLRKCPNSIIVYQFSYSKLKENDYMFAYEYMQPFASMLRNQFKVRDKVNEYIDTSRAVFIFTSNEFTYDRQTHCGDFESYKNVQSDTRLFLRKGIEKRGATDIFKDTEISVIPYCNFTKSDVQPMFRKKLHERACMRGLFSRIVPEICIDDKNVEILSSIYEKKMNARDTITENGRLVWRMSDNCVIDIIDDVLKKTKEHQSRRPMVILGVLGKERKFNANVKVKIDKDGDLKCSVGFKELLSEKEKKKKTRYRYRYNEL